MVLPLKEYPVSEIMLVSAFNGERYTQENGRIIEPEFYRPMIGNGYNEEMIFELLLSSSVRPYEYSFVNVTYLAGYKKNEIPEDLSAACLELASWNFNRYKGKRIGMSGNIKGAGVQGEHFELSMPENVKALIEPYKRKTI